ncbi:MAG: hypothetical protein KGI54_16365 [Pseudomonadota bacterium]|nr:hypothetical protein [Pseudomonadota bacterium]
MHKFIEEYCEKIIPVGSRVTCVPAPTNTDQDFLVLCNDSNKAASLFQVLTEDGFELGGSCPFADFSEDIVYGFNSSKKGDVNYIVTASQSFFDDFLLASNIAKKLNLLDKQQRVDLFQIILYKNFGEHEFVED